MLFVFSFWWDWFGTLVVSFYIAFSQGVSWHGNFIALGDSIDIPDHLYEALVLYVSGLYLSHMGGEQHTAKGDNYYGLYLKMMGEDEINNSSGTSETTDDDTRFQDRGFV